MPIYEGHGYVLYIDGQPVGEVHGKLLEGGFIEVSKQEVASLSGLSATFEVTTEDPEAFQRLFDDLDRLGREGRRLQVLNDRHPRRSKGERKRNRKDRWR